MIVALPVSGKGQQILMSDNRETVFRWHQSTASNNEEQVRPAWGATAGATDSINLDPSFKEKVEGRKSHINPISELVNKIASNQGIVLLDGAEYTTYVGLVGSTHSWYLLLSSIFKSIPKIFVYNVFSKTWKYEDRTWPKYKPE